MRGDGGIQLLRLVGPVSGSVGSWRGLVESQDSDGLQPKKDGGKPKTNVFPCLRFFYDAIEYTVRLLFLGKLSMVEVWWEIGIVAAFLAAVGFALGLGRRRIESVSLDEARRSFHFEREWLEARFVQRAIANSQPESPRWAECTFDDDVAYVRNRSTGELSALVAVSISADRSDSVVLHKADAIGNLQAGTAVFRFDGHHRATDGRAILNLSPRETIRHFRNDIEMIDEDPMSRA